MNDQPPDKRRREAMIERRRMLASRVGLYRPAMVAAGFGLLLSVAAAYAVGRWERRVAWIEFEGIASTQLMEMQNGINEYLGRLVTLRTLFESANEDVTRSEFEVFGSRLFEGHFGVLRVGWLPKVYRKERADYEAAAVNDGVPAYHFKSLAGGEVSAAPEADFYFPVFFSTEAKTSPVYGMDYSTDPVRWAALERARDNDAVSVVRTRLFKDILGDAHGVLVGVPVYAKGTSRATVADRRRNLTGFVIGLFDLSQLLQSIRGKSAAASTVILSAFPPTPGEDGGTERRRVPDYSSATSASQSVQAFATGPHWSGTLKIGDANWRVEAIPAGGGDLAARHGGAITVLMAGCAITIFLSGYLSMASRNSRELALANRRVLELAQTDILTGLPNRAYFLEQLKEAGSHQFQDGVFSILMLDLDRFKNVNDSLGHAAGDTLLQQVAARLRSTLRLNDVLARLGGDEFAIIQAGYADQRENSIDLASRISKLISEPFQLFGHRVEIGTSIGIAIAPEHGSDEEQLLKKADLALYRSKAAGRNCFTLYDEAMSAELEARNTLEGDLRDAIARCLFEVHYQPYFDVQTGCRQGAEALIRWRHPDRGLIPPDQFIPLAEETGLIVPLGEWIIRQACDDATAWSADTKVSINLSPVQFKQAELFEVIESALLKSGLPPERLEIEITESVLLERAAENLAFMERLRSTGVSLALDDFGTGYSSLSCLTAFPFDKIKIDKSFMGNLSANYQNSAIISSIVTLGRGLDISVTAEGVETLDQLEGLKRLGVNFAQGYLLGRPVPAAELAGQPAIFGSRRDAA